MKKYIIISMVLALFVTGCGKETKKENIQSKDSSAQTQQVNEEDLEAWTLESLLGDALTELNETQQEVIQEHINKINEIEALDLQDERLDSLYEDLMTKLSEYGIDLMSSSNEANPIEGQDLSKIEMETYDGDKLSGDQFKENKITVLNLWATWCGPCIEEMPDFEEVYQNYKEKGVDFIGLALESDEEEVKAIKDQLNITYTLVKENDQLKALISSHFDYVPVTLFIDSQGNVLATFIPGGTTENGLSQILDDLIQ